MLRQHSTFENIWRLNVWQLFINYGIAYFNIAPSVTANGWGLTGACSLIVVLGTLANLASVASSIIVYKDWIVIVAGGDIQMLARKIRFEKCVTSIAKFDFDLIRNELNLPID